MYGRLISVEVWLSSQQLEDGNYSSYGVPNTESTAQVILALSSLGIDGFTDERFIKNENTLTFTSDLVFEIPAIHTCTVICGNAQK